MSIIGAADHYAQFVELCRLRIAELNISYDTVDDICGFPLRYTGKLMNGSKAMSVYSMFALAKTLGLSPMFHHDAEGLQKLQARSDWITSRVQSRVLSTHLSTHRRPGYQRTKQFLRSIQALGGIGRALKLTAEERSRSAQRAAKARWRKKNGQKRIRNGFHNGRDVHCQSV